MPEGKHFSVTLEVTQSFMCPKRHTHIVDHSIPYSRKFWCKKIWSIDLVTKIFWRSLVKPHALKSMQLAWYALLSFVGSDKITKVKQAVVGSTGENF